MAKVLVLSDSHGNTKTMQAIINLEKDIDLLIHCGDLEISSEIATLTQMADAPVYAVSGNCDIFSDLSKRVDFDFKGHHILVTHGYYENVNSGIGELKRKAGLFGADIVFFGHTHVPFLREEDGVIYANPGSTDKPRQTGRESTYMIMTIEGDEKPKIELKKYSF
ncbi:MAG: metallophosphoesterase [Lachnospiraceae bacterium]|nr:metallophosphoesterase [Lachnospiraceae bacterium]